MTSRAVTNAAAQQRTSAQPEIAYAGRAITLPDTPHKMPVDDAIETLYAYKDEQEASVAISERIDAFPFDGAWAMMKAMRDLYGWVKPVPTPSFFGPEPPLMIGIQIAFGEMGRVIWGSFEIPSIVGRFQCGITDHEGRKVFEISGETRRRHEPDIMALVERTKHYVDTESIYKGQPIALVADEEGEVDWHRPPKFFDTSGTDVSSLIFSAELMRQIETNIFVPIERTETCRALGIPLKRGVLLEGPYGTGKTLTASITAKKAQQNGWTFLMVNHPGALPSVLEIARLYQPCVVFAEDIDRVMAGQGRNINMDFILNTIDGIHSKDADILVVLTTNHIERINRAMLRPGRIDAALSLTPPDAEASQALIRYYADDMVDPDTDLTGAGKQLAGHVPAVIREVVERGKLYAIREMGDDLGTVESLSGQVLEDAAIGMRTHLKFLAEPTEETMTPSAMIGGGIKALVEQSVHGDIDLEGVYASVGSLQSHIDGRTGSLMKAIKDLTRFVKDRK